MMESVCCCVAVVRPSHQTNCCACPFHRIRTCSWSTARPTIHRSNSHPLHLLADTSGGRAPQYCHSAKWQCCCLLPSNVTSPHHQLFIHHTQVGNVYISRAMAYESAIDSSIYAALADTLHIAHITAIGIDRIER